MAVFIFLKHNGLCGSLTDSNYFYAEEPIPCTNYRVRVTPFACTFPSRSYPHTQFVKAWLATRKILFYTHRVLRPALGTGCPPKFSMAFGSSNNHVNYCLLNLHPFLFNAEEGHSLHFLDLITLHKKRVSQVGWSPYKPLTREISYKSKTTIAKPITIWYLYQFLWCNGIWSTDL